MLSKFICAVVTRSLFVFVSFVGVWRVVHVRNDGLYWFLTFLFLPLIAEMIVTLKRRRGNDYKWFSPAIFLFLISIIPSLWILELHHKQNPFVSSRCKKLNSAENIQSVLNSLMNSTASSESFVTALSSVCANDWILALHQILVVLLIVGKWLLPAAGELSRDQLSQLLLTFVGTAADILEFTSETLSDIRGDSLNMVYVILAVWTWSMLQFPLHLSVMAASVEDLSSASVLSHLRAEIWSTVEALLIQDGPFLLVRLVVMCYFGVVHQMLIFFAIKNLLVVILNIYRLSVLICDKSL